MTAVRNDLCAMTEGIEGDGAMNILFKIDGKS